MSDPCEALVTPVEAFEPPYYVVVFTATRTRAQSGYGATAARMEELMRDVPGFLRMDQAHTPGGLSVTVGYFRDAEAVAAWRSHRRAPRGATARASRVVRGLHAACGESGAQPRIPAGEGRAGIRG